MTLDGGNPAPAAGDTVDPAPQRAAGAAQRFVYAGGATPLDGYTIKRGIGRGGFGEVYFALSDGGKEVALKLVRQNLDIELRGVAHCLNLKHPHLLALFDVKEDGQGNTWVVMEYVAGDSLEAMIDRHPQGMSADEALRRAQVRLERGRDKAQQQLAALSESLGDIAAYRRRA